MANKKLTISAVRKENAILNEKFTVSIKDGKYEVIVNKYFKKNDIPKLIGDFMSINEQLKSDEKTTIDYANSIYLFHILLVKFMTNIPLPENGLELIAYIGELLNIDVLEEVLNALPKEEVSKATEWFNETLSKMPEALPQMVDLVLKSEMMKHGNIQ